MEIVLLLVRLFLFGVFALAGVGKLMDLEGSEKAVKGFGVPDSLAKPIGFGLPVFEIFLALLFLFVSTSWFAAIAAVLLISIFLGGMIYQIARGNAPDCHCFGQIHSEPVGKSSLLRNGGFAILALFLAIQGRANQGASIADGDSGMTIVLVLVLAVLAVGVFYLKRIFDQQGELMRRIDLLELISKDGGQVEREEAVPPTEGLAIGSPFPEFKLKQLDGTSVSRSDVFASGKPSAVFFVSPDCSPCKTLYPEIREWQNELGDKLDFVFVSSGDLKANRDKYGDTDGIRVIVEEKRELAESVKAQWTPSALFVNADGRIGSYVSTGDSAIRLLIDDLRERDLGAGFVFVVNSIGAAQALKIGENVPDFSLTGADGETVTNDSIAGRNTLAVFWSMTCPHCVNMKEAFVELENSQNGSPNLIFFSDGNPAENRELGFKSPVVLDARYTVSKELGMSGTPSAVLIDEKGRIASGTATGEQKIWALIGKR